MESAQAINILSNNLGLESLSHNPMFFTLLKEYRSDRSSFFSVKEVYDWLFQRWFSHQKDLLEKEGLLKDYEGNFIEHCWVYTHAVALKLRAARKIRINFKDKAFLENNWDRFFDSNTQAHLVQKACPWKEIEGNKVSLYHADIVTYFANLNNYDLKNQLHLPFIYGNEGLEELSQLLDCEVLGVDSSQLSHLVADILIGDVSKNSYFRLVYLSAKTEKFARIAANAMTILNVARIPFSGMHLLGIRIPKAILTKALFDHTNLSDTDLRFVDFTDAWLRNAKLDKACMNGVIFNELPYLNGNQFYESGDNQFFVTVERSLNNLKKSLITLYNSNSTSKEIGKIMVESGVSCVTFSQDNIKLAIGYQSGKINIWEIEKNMSLKILQRHLKSITSLVFLNNSQNLVSSANDGLLLFWDINSQQSRVINNDSRGRGLIISIYDKNIIATLDYRFPTGTYFKYWLLSAFEYFEENRQYYKASSQMDIVCMVTNPIKNTCFAIGSYHGSIYVGDFLSSYQTHVFKDVHQNGTICLAYNSSGDLLASGGEDKIIRIWDLKGKYCKGTINEEIPIKKIAFSYDSNYLFYMGDDNVIKQRRIFSGRLIDQVDEKLGAIGKIKYKDKIFYFLKRIRRGGYEIAYVVNKETSESIELKAKGLDGPFYSMDIDNSFSFLAAGSAFGKISIWDLKKKECIKIGQGHAGGAKIFDIKFDSHGKLLFTASGDKTIKIWDIENGECMNTLTGHQDSVFCLAFNPTNPNILVSGGADKTIRFWNIKNSKCEKTFSEFQGAVCTIKFHSNGKELLLGGADKMIQIMDFEKNVVNSLIGHQDVVYSLNYDPTYKFIISGSNDGIIKLWDRSSYNCLYTFTGHKGMITDLCWSIDGKFLLSSSVDYTAKLWRMVINNSNGKNEICFQLIWQSGYCRLNLDNISVNQVTGLTKDTDYKFIQQKSGNVRGKPNFGSLDVADQEYRWGCSMF